MQQTLRPYVTAGIAMVGSGLVAVTPVAAPVAEVSVVRNVALTAGDGVVGNLLGTWGSVWNTTAENMTQLLQNYYLSPGVAFQQFLANQTDFWQQVLDDPNQLNAVNAQMQDNLEAVLTGYSLSGATQEVIDSVMSHTLSKGDGVTDLLGHFGLVGLLPQFLPAGIDPETVTPIVNFLSSPLSGVIMGMIGPGISPWVALMNSLEAHDSFSDTLANMTGAFFNGATLSLDSLLPLINNSGVFPPGLSVEHLDIAFGGLFSGGSVAVGPYEVMGAGGQVAGSVDAVGGSIFNSIGIDLGGVPLLGSLSIASHAVGPIAAWESWSQAVGALLGTGWDGKTPVVVVPPGVNIDFPTIPDSWFDDSMPDAGDASNWLGDLLGGLIG
ncbi:outer membrane porin GjpA [Mycolicibacter heraklionensis]|uniref:outer membrane porin GjpA n=1 Tax=Mycolicibacter heraklionensis TaxID=512402 RepID=UPI000AE25638|nr:outer membrane porin GjpA [Mycolicibacter heraklionensis]